MSAEIKSRPTPGFLYKVKSGDWISKLAAAAYGNDQRWPLIEQANSNFSTTDEIGGVPQTFFQPGNIIYIPILPGKDNEYNDSIPNRDKDEFTIMLDNIELPIESARLMRTMDTISDGWSCVIAWNPGADYEIDKLTSAFSYTNSACYLGGKLKGVGKLYNIRQSIKGRREKQLEFFSKTIDIVDSTMRPPYEKNNITLLQRVIDQVEKYAIEVNVDSNADPGGAFKRVTGKPTTKVWDHLSKLASQRGVLLSSDEHSNILITVANINGKSVGIISEGESIGQEFEIFFNGRNRYTEYKAISQNVRTKGSRGYARDSKINGSRLLTFDAADSLAGELKSAAEWKRNKMIADSLTFPLPVSSWYDPKGNLWRENTNVNVVSSTMSIPDGFKFLIRNVEYIYESSGTTAILSLVPPHVYSKDEFDEPWLK